MVNFNVNKQGLHFYSRASFLELIQSEIGENNTVISAETAKFLVNCFKEKCQAVLILAFAANDDDEVSIFLSDVVNLMKRDLI